MRVLFYLPVVTPWWFDNIVAPVIDHLAAQAEVHVIVPPLWRGTGIGPDQLPRVAAADLIQWHIMDGEDHQKLRTGGAPFDELIDLVHDIDPDISLCRSADLDTPRRFPGIVRYMMEAAFPPFPSLDQWFVLREQPFDHCVMPRLGPTERHALDAGFEEIWSAVSRKVAGRSSTPICAARPGRATSSSPSRSNMSMRRISSAFIDPMPKMRSWWRRSPRRWTTACCLR